MNPIFFSDQRFIIPLLNNLTAEQITYALTPIDGLEIISISSDCLEVSCTNPKIDKGFIEKFLLDYKLRTDIEKQLNLDTKQLVQNIINASLGTV